MALRIYSLAKELKLDSKELVDICPKAGVTGKGSALASLTDDEVEKIKSYLAGGTSKPAASRSAAGGTAVASRTAAEPSAIRREEYIAPAGTTVAKRAARPAAPEKGKDEGDGKKKPADAPKPPQRVSPAIKLAPLPPTSAAAPTTVPEEPAPQKPDIKLPADAIRAGKAGGSKPLSEHLRKHELRRKAEAAKHAGGSPGAQHVAPAGEPASPATAPRERGRRGKAHVEEKPGVFDDSLGGREQRQLKRKRGATTRRAGEDDDSPTTTAPVRRPRIRQRRSTGVSTAAPRKSKVVIELPCTVRSFSEAIGVPARTVLQTLLGLGTMTGINAQLEAEMAELLAVELGVNVELRQHVTLEDKVLAALDSETEDPERMVPRPPVVTFLGHVDHGKTSLLDKIIGTNVVSGESGGITQHIRAYCVQKDDRAVAFVDTPGHEAFTQMRARGANVTDIAVLVVAADDGVMPQTEEAISHARAAGVPIVVALNKIDLPGIDINRIYQQLAANDLLPSEWSGDTEVIKTSAMTGEGIDNLLDTLLTIAELHDYRADPQCAARGTCLESEMHEDRGVVAKVLVQRGTLRVGDVIVCGTAYGRVKAMYDTLAPSKTLSEAGPSIPVNLTGFDLAPEAGERFYVLDDIAVAREIAQRRSEQNRRTALSGGPTHVTLENLFDRLSREEVPTLNLILRADTRGSIEAIRKELTKLEHPEVQIKVLQATVGGVSEADVHLADASDAVIISFNVVPDEAARTLAEQRGVQIRRYDIIYQVTDDLKAALEGMLKPEQREKELGRALVQRLFHISRLGTICGCRVLAGNINRNARIRVIRDSRIVGDYPLDSLRREKDDVREVREGLECGIKLAGFDDVKEGDLLEAYTVEEVARTFD